jgi:hypothetical protein
MQGKRPRELQLAKAELLILLDCIDLDQTELSFLELHAKALLNHIASAKLLQQKQAPAEQASPD